MSTTLIIVVAAIALIALFAISGYNRLVRLNISVDEAFSQIEVQLKRRSDLAVPENYPDSQASANFLALQEELSTTENKVSFARQFYNDNVRSLNQAIKSFPSNLFVSMAHVSVREFYVVDDPASRQAPNVKF